jgi:hypothetical protein
MGSVKVLGCCMGLVAVLATAGCGGSSGGSGAATTAGASTGGSGAATSGGGVGGGRAIQTPVQSRGIKGEDPSAEAATKARLSAADCKALAALAERRTGTRLARRASPKPPLSRCRLEGRGTSINVFLDAAFAANQRYHNRIEETVQFNTENPAGLPQPVPHVGEKAAYNSDASWIPALRSLLAVRGNRWLTVTITVAGRSDRQLRTEAAVLARAGFRLST